ncbi:MAG: MBL fold metallo-hydrolase [Lachnospiraceae bacterium]|nr:MBL fold metallo-hydrolase [Lachnospiraceae bacterium]
MEKIRKEQLTEQIWLLDDNGDTTGFVIVGKDKAMVVDTMNGSEDVYMIVREITDLPLIVVNTHGHPDHIGGNHFFKEIYINERDVQMIDVFSSPEAKKQLPKVNLVREGDIFDLGEYTVEVYELPGHTVGSILLLLKEERILFTGDAINHHLWMQLEDSLPLEENLKQLERLSFLKDKADRILHGHTKNFDDIGLFTLMENGIRELVHQKDLEITDKDPDYNWFGGVAKQHKFDNEGSVICYRPENRLC